MPNSAKFNTSSREIESGNLTDRTTAVLSAQLDKRRPFRIRNAHPSVEQRRLVLTWFSLCLQPIRVTISSGLWLEFFRCEIGFLVKLGK